MISIKDGVAKNIFLQKLISKFGRPIISTSLNISGQKTLEDLAKIEKYFKNEKPDLVINAGRLKKKKASRLVDIREVEKVRVIRK